MAIVFDTPGSSAVQGATSDSFSYTVGAGSNRALWVVATCWNSTDFLSGAAVSYGGTSLGAPIVNMGSATNEFTYVWQMAAPPAGSATVLVTPSGGAYFDVWAISANGVDQTNLADTAHVATFASNFSTSPESQSVTTPSGGACFSYCAFRINPTASTLTPVSGNGFTLAGTPPSGSYAHTAVATAQAPTAHGWGWTNGSPGNDTMLMIALPIFAAAGGGGGRLFRQSVGGQLTGVGTNGPFYTNPLN